MATRQTVECGRFRKRRDRWYCIELTEDGSRLFSFKSMSEPFSTKREAMAWAVDGDAPFVVGKVQRRKPLKK